MNSIEYMGKGYCKMRSISNYEDYCNDSVVLGGEFCEHHTCSVFDCLSEAKHYKSKQVCDEHYHLDLGKDTGTATRFSKSEVLKLIGMNDFTLVRKVGGK